jgi:hypothetical protein
MLMPISRTMRVTYGGFYEQHGAFRAAVDKMRAEAGKR